jgi:hypothetical protein
MTSPLVGPSSAQVTSGANTDRAMPNPESGCTPLARSLLFGVEPRDPLVFSVSILTIVAVGILAALIPARRAARVDPMEALRAD